jgi:hypothetical protein
VAAISIIIANCSASLGGPIPFVPFTDDKGFLIREGLSEQKQLPEFGPSLLPKCVEIVDTSEYVKRLSASGYPWMDRPPIMDGYHEMIMLLWGQIGHFTALNAIQAKVDVCAIKGSILVGNRDFAGRGLAKIFKFDLNLRLWTGRQIKRSDGFEMNIGAKLPSSCVVGLSYQLNSRPRQENSRNAENDSEYGYENRRNSGNAPLLLVSKIADTGNVQPESIENAEDRGMVLVKRLVAFLVLSMLYALSEFLRFTDRPKQKSRRRDDDD